MTTTFGCDDDSTVNGFQQRMLLQMMIDSKTAIMHIRIAARLYSNPFQSIKINTVILVLSSLLKTYK